MNKSTKLDFSGQNIFVGLDTHLKSWMVSIVVGNTPFKTFSQDPRPETLRNYLTKNFPNATFHSAYEASFCGFKIHRDLLNLGIKNIVVNPADIPTTDKERKQKEDSRDSRKIARQLSQNDLTPIYVHDIETEGDRSFIRYRKTLSKEIARTKNRIKSHMHYYGIEIPVQFSGKNNWPRKFILWLKEIEFATQSARKVLDEHLELLELLRKKKYTATRQIRELSQKETYRENYTLLLSIPGVGLITAMIILTEIGDIRRFKNLDHLCSYIGFVPTTKSTGEREKTGDITTRRNKMLRTAIIESAWIAIRNDPALILAYQELTKRMSSQKAIIRIAKKLVSRIQYVLKNKKPYVCAIVK